MRSGDRLIAASAGTSLPSICHPPAEPSDIGRHQREHSVKADGDDAPIQPIPPGASNAARHRRRQKSQTGKLPPGTTAARGKQNSAARDTRPSPARAAILASVKLISGSSPGCASPIFGPVEDARNLVSSTGVSQVVSLASLFDQAEIILDRHSVNQFELDSCALHAIGIAPILRRPECFRRYLAGSHVVGWRARSFAARDGHIRGDGRGRLRERAGWRPFL